MAFRSLLLFVCIVYAAAYQLSMSGVQRIDAKERDGVRKLLSFGGILLGSVALSHPSAAGAKVFFDTDTYGDKELKIATVNKIKQKLRNAILEDITLAPDLLKLALNDALSYNAATDDNGPNGSILFELEREENKGLKKAVDVIQKIKKELQRTTSVSFSDLVAFGGAEALETVGSERVIVQVGRTDAKKESDSQAKAINWSNLSAESATGAFSTAGLTSRELVLLLGALGEITRIVEETQALAKE